MLQELDEQLRGEQDLELAAAWEVDPFKDVLRGFFATPPTLPDGRLSVVDRHILVMQFGGRSQDSSAEDFGTTEGFVTRCAEALLEQKYLPTEHKQVLRSAVSANPITPAALRKLCVAALGALLRAEREAGAFQPFAARVVEDVVLRTWC